MGTPQKLKPEGGMFGTRRVRAVTDSAMIESLGCKLQALLGLTKASG